MSRDPALDLRWTRVCFCGQRRRRGRRSPTSRCPACPFLTGSEEGRGPLFDVTGVPFEGRRSRVGSETQGHKIGVDGRREQGPSPRPCR